MKVGFLMILVTLVSSLFALNMNLKIPDKELEDEWRATESAIRETRSVDPQNSIEDPLKVLSFSDDNDNRLDSNEEFTRHIFGEGKSA